MKRLLLLLPVFVVAFAAGMLMRDADATVIGGGGSTISIATGSGGAVGVSGPIAITGPFSVTGASGFTGVTIVGPSGAPALTVSGPPIGVFDAIDITDTNGTTTATRYGILINAWGNTIGGAAAKFRTTGANGDALVIDSSPSTGGYALKITADTTSPAFPAMLLTPQDTNPTNTSAIGGLFMFSGGFLRVETATSPRWEDVGSFLSLNTGITAFPTGGQASATTVCNVHTYNVVGTVGTAGDSIKLAAPQNHSKSCVIKNSTATSLNLFPQSSAQLCLAGATCLTANTATAVAGNAEITCWSQSSTIWNCR